VFPQASVFLIKPLGVLFVQLVKATSLVSLITIPDLTYRAYQLNQLSMQIVPIFGTVLIIYYLMTKLVAGSSSLLDGYLGTWRRPGAVKP
jgi:polar amino acid transport system permease protein